MERKSCRDCWWNLWRMERKRICEKLRRRKNELKRRLRDLYGSFTDRFTDGYKINYYFNLFRRWSVKNPSVNFEFRTKIFNDPPFFWWSVGNSVDTMTRSDMNLMHNLWNSRSPSVIMSVKLTRRQITDELISVSMYVGDCGISSNYFRTLYEMPTDLYPSEETSVCLWHFK